RRDVFEVRRALRQLREEAPRDVAREIEQTRRRDPTTQSMPRALHEELPLASREEHRVVQRAPIVARPPRERAEVLVTKIRDALLVARAEPFERLHVKVRATPQHEEERDVERA